MTVAMPKSSIVGGNTTRLSNGAFSSITSISTKNQNRGIVLLFAFAAVFSPLSSFSYYPARHALVDDVHISLNKIDLPIASLRGGVGSDSDVDGWVADKLGRKPVYLVILTIYIVANIGLALQRSYPVSLVLRTVRSVSSSGWRSMWRYT